jgi:hypothetical protein
MEDEGPKVPDPLTPDSLRTELARIDYEVDAGNRDLRALGFWRLLAQVKRDPALIEIAAEPAGRIDAKAFDAYTKLRFPVWLGNLVLIVGVGVGALAIVVAMEAADATVAGVALILAAGIWSVAVHSPAHWVVGRALGMRFRCYFLGGPFPPRPGLKTDYASYLRTPAEHRAWMHASGALATKVAPFVALAFYPATDAPMWAAAVVLAIGIVQILTDVFLSTKTSDWKKVKRELRIARDAT